MLDWYMKKSWNRVKRPYVDEPIPDTVYSPFLVEAAMQSIYRNFIKIVTTHIKRYLKNEMGLEPIDISYKLTNVTRVNLRSTTALVALAGGIEIYMVFSFDAPVIESISKIYTQDLGIADHEQAIYIEETAGDLVNLIAGNSLAEVESSDLVTITPPLYISGEKQIGKSKGAEFYIADLKFEDGIMSLIFIGPKNLFDEKLEYKD